ncbi:hypothetical protein JB92DRAFT_2882461 [Gautieria morchelliformis]|nr:hypothetical protein JB92DRAFT_2882461 [Gautieria morchelliformis]
MPVLIIYHHSSARRMPQTHPPMPVSRLSDIGMNSDVLPASNVVYLTPYERGGVIAMAVAATLSCVLVSSLLLAVGLPALLNWRRKSPDASATLAPFSRKQVAVFVICLLCSDLIQSISGIIQVKWAAERRLVEGTTCAIQAAALVIGDLGSAVWSFVIAGHTFSALALERNWSRQVVVSTVITGWTFVILMAAFGPLVLTNKTNGPFFSIAGTWCFISNEYSVARLGIHYIPLLIAAAVIVMFYGLVFLVLLGTISFTRHRSLGPLSDEISRQRVVIAKRVLWYPFAYLTCILPISVARIVGLRDDSFPDIVWIIGMFLLFSLGTADAVIYATTRHMINHHRLPAPPPAIVTTFIDTRASMGAGLSNHKLWGHVLDIEMPKRPSSLPTYKGPPSLATPAGEALSRHTWREPQRCGVHVTLERTQKVI